MAVTTLQRKGRRNKTRARVKKQVRKLANSVVTVASPYKEVSGIIIDDNAPAKTIEVEQEISAEDIARAEAVMEEVTGGDEPTGEAKSEENNEEKEAE